VPFTCIFCAGTALAGLSEIPILLEILIVIICTIAIIFRNLNLASVKYISDCKCKKIYFFFILLLIGALYCDFYEANLEKRGELLCCENEITGLICAAEKKSDEQVRFEVDTGKGRVLVNVYENIEDCSKYEGYEALFKGKIYIAQSRRNPGCFDYKRHLESVNICAVMTVDESGFCPIKEKDRVLSLLSDIRSNFIEKISQHAGVETAALMSGLLFGDKNSLSDDIYEHFQKNGTAHVLAVSGLHIGLAYALAEKISGRKRTLKNGIVKGLAVIFYAAIAGFTPSVCRAVGMILMSITASVSHRRYDMLSAACVVCLISVVKNPIILFNTGFQLSYLAVLSIIFTVERFKSLYSGLLSSSIAIQFGMAPIIAYNFNYFSFVSLFINIPILFFASILVPVGIFALIITQFQPNYVTEHLVGILATVLDLIGRFMIWCNEIAFMEGKSYAICTSPKLWQIVLFYCTLFFGSSETAFILYSRKNKKIMITICIMFLLIALVANFLAYTPVSDAEIVFVDVGQGDCLHIRTENGKNILIDGGGSATYDVGKNTLLPYLLKNGVKKIDLAIITHMHTDHYKGIESLAEHMKIERIGVYEGYSSDENSLRDNLSTYKKPFLYLHAGEKIQISDKVCISIIYPERKAVEEYDRMIESEKDENKMSLITVVEYDGIKIMMTADIDADGEKALIKEVGENNLSMKADILKVPHHGSKYSSSQEFIDTVDPSIAVIQSGKNNFGHPDEKVIEKYIESDIILYRNDQCGAIGIYDIKNSSGKIATTINFIGDIVKNGIQE